MKFKVGDTVHLSSVGIIENCGRLVVSATVMEVKEPCYFVTVDGKKNFGGTWTEPCAFDSRIDAVKNSLQLCAQLRDEALQVLDRQNNKIARAIENEIATRDGWGA